MRKKDPIERALEALAVLSAEELRVVLIVTRRAELASDKPRRIVTRHRLAKDTTDTTDLPSALPGIVGLKSR